MASAMIPIFSYSFVYLGLLYTSAAQSVQFVRKHWSHAERMCARTARYVNIQNQLDIHFICLSPLKYFGEQRHTLWGENCFSKCYRQNLPVKVIRRVMDELQPPHCFIQTGFCRIRRCILFFLKKIEKNQEHSFTKWYGFIKVFMMEKRASWLFRTALWRVFIHWFVLWW